MASHGTGRCLSLRGRGNRQQVWRGLCVWRGTREAVAQSQEPGPLLSGLETQGGGPGIGLGRAHLCAPLTRLLGAVPGPEGTHSQLPVLQVGVPGREREGLSSWASAWLADTWSWPGQLCGASPSPLCARDVWCPGWPWQGTLCHVTVPQSCVVSLTLGVGVCDVPSWP